MDAPRNRLDQPVFPIRTAAELTGIATGTLRAWERRYGFVQPERTASGHRLYSQRDIQRLRDACLLIEGGVSLSQVCSLLDDEDICDALPGESARWPRLAMQTIDALDSFNPGALEEMLRQGLMVADPDDVSRHFMIPVLRDLALRWRVERRVAEQRLVESALHKLLGNCPGPAVANDRDKPVLASVLPGEEHQIGLLMLAILAVRHGVPVTMLGIGTPVDELVSASRITGAPAVLLYGHRTPQPDTIRGPIRALAYAADCPVLIVGPTVGLVANELRHAGATALDNPEDVFQLLGHVLGPLPASEAKS